MDNQSKSTNLKPCPFCGGEAIVLQNDDGYHYIGCKSAECRGYVFYNYVYYFTKERASEAWNTRKPIDEIIEQLTMESFTPSDREFYGNLVSLEDAIEIVMKGSVT